MSNKAFSPEDIKKICDFFLILIEIDKGEQRKKKLRQKICQLLAQIKLKKSECGNYDES